MVWFKTEPRFGDLLVLVLIQNEFSCLSRRVDDQRVTIETVQHDGVLRTKVISRQTVSLPAQSVVSVRQILQQIKQPSTD